MAGLCEGGNEPPGSLKANLAKDGIRAARMEDQRLSAERQTTCVYCWDIIDSGIAETPHVTICGEMNLFEFHGLLV
ncbi:hypothetical protein ANN_13785 [Periplaneta americana]|uniref:Uncharacterized protein n=1 Tax=Periplaneta americana TaxID=6978 RepID=A0ABQ8SUL7_PERAM|nr:hypothetical protein ANN_13785 [Periplaneta americana]